MCYCHLIILWHFYFQFGEILLGTVCLHKFINFTENSICISRTLRCCATLLLNSGSLLQSFTFKLCAERKVPPNYLYLHPVEGSEMLQWFYPPSGLNSELLIFLSFCTHWKSGQRNT